MTPKTAWPTCRTTNAFRINVTQRQKIWKNNYTVVSYNFSTFVNTSYKINFWLVDRLWESEDIEKQNLCVNVM